MVKVKNAEVAQAQQEKVVVVPMTGKAIGTSVDPDTGRWSAVVLEFNLTTGAGRVLRSVEVGASKLEAAEKFKLLAIEEGVVV